MDAERTSLGLALLFTKVVALCLLVGVIGASAAQALERSAIDRPDDSGTRQQVHVIYALPSNGTDNALDTDGTLAESVGVWQSWLRTQTGGKGLTLDTAGGELDITFARLPSTDAQLASEGLFIRDRIESELAGLGLLAAGKLYAVYYDGSANGACGGAPWPQSAGAVASPGQQVGAFYLQGVPGGGAPNCNTTSFAGAGDPPGYKEFAMLHELIHGLGIVPTCAPNHTLAGHVSDSPTDLMYAGNQPWAPSVLDVGRNDYFNAGVPGCLDLAASKYLEGNGDPPPSSGGTGGSQTPTDPTGPTGGGNGTSTPAADPPETDKGRGPKAKSKSRKATFRFSSETAASFECRLDRGDWETCTSPAKVRKLSEGAHRFFVRAIGVDGTVDETPVTWKFKVAT
jgi:hypothetical protein